MGVLMENEKAEGLRLIKKFPIVWNLWKPINNIVQFVLVLSIWGIPIALPSDQVPKNTSPERPGVEPTTKKTVQRHTR